MRRYRPLLLGLICMGLVVATTAWAGSATYQGLEIVRVLVNGRSVQSDVPPVLLNGRAMLPLRAVAEALGADVAWDAATSTAEVTMAAAGALEVENQRLRNQLSIAEGNVEAFRTERDDLSRRLESVSAELEGVRSDLAGAQKQISDLQALVSSLEASRTAPAPPASGAQVPTQIASAADLQRHLNSHFDSATTPMGEVKMSYAVTYNNRTYPLYDFEILIHYEPTALFLDIDTLKTVSAADKTRTLDILRAHARSVYDAAAGAFPGQKIEGSYFKSWWQYPTIMAGYESRRALSWSNFEERWTGTDYEADLTEFHFTPEKDDYKLDP